jgi:hypothetical protein
MPWVRPEPPYPPRQPPVGAAVAEMEPGQMLNPGCVATDGHRLQRLRGDRGHRRIASGIRSGGLLVQREPIPIPGIIP